jgi:CHRD domain
VTPNAQAVGQGIAAGEFDELVDAIRAGFTYANVHTTAFPPGEIRAQIKAHGGGNDD